MSKVVLNVGYLLCSTCGRLERSAVDVICVNCKNLEGCEYCPGCCGKYEEKTSRGERTCKHITGSNVGSCSDDLLLDEWCNYCLCTEVKRLREALASIAEEGCDRIGDYDAGSITTTCLEREDSEPCHPCRAKAALAEEEC